MGIVSALYVFFPYIEIVWTSKYVWRIIGLFWILAHSSGFMFNSIRGTQYAGQDGKGGISYIAGGFQSQYQLESQIIGVACESLAISLPRKWENVFFFSLANDLSIQMDFSLFPLLRWQTRSPVLPTPESSLWQFWPGVASCWSATASCLAFSASRTAATHSLSHLSCKVERWPFCGPLYPARGQH